VVLPNGKVVMEKFGDVEHQIKKARVDGMRSLIDKNKVEYTIYHALQEQKPIIDIIITTQIDNLSIVPSNLNLTGAEVELVGVIGREFKLKNALEKSKENAFLSKKLATLKFDVEVDSVQDFEKKPFDKTILFEFLKKYSLNSIIAKLLPNYHHNQGDLFTSEVIPEKNETKLNTKEEFQTIVAKFISQKEEEVIVNFVKNSNLISLETKTEKFIFSL
jgi:hypothetical protein